ncbi:hypothetical protein HCBG_07612 [Histoplasma capsulatum G186AR]|uniref:Uncharacterized protein n=1 Tax=Ajellomyces capsulatus (strain G186AR / H82 / ATCC MYA-2454 / RMSCC 2432) TaxID=447093 RepID=C0NWT2_AJECG|nr:uncharacterized protein HCBG_07612 [Histoplasma capsulatum G186AR]EEH04387.1 hypothetical protein HCBG_07612 [Histoplasma capsulatum G186AR]
MHFSLHKYTSQQQWAIDVCTTPNDTTMRCAFFALSLSALGREKKWKDGGRDGHWRPQDDKKEGYPPRRRILSLCKNLGAKELNHHQRHGGIEGTNHPTQSPQHPPSDPLYHPASWGNLALPKFHYPTAIGPWWPGVFLGA